MIKIRGITYFGSTQLYPESNGPKLSQLVKWGPFLFPPQDLITSSPLHSHSLAAHQESASLEPGWTAPHVIKITKKTKGGLFLAVWLGMTWPNMRTCKSQIYRDSRITRTDVLLYGGFWV